MKKVMILAPVHSYDDVRVYQKEALSLVNAGYDVTLLARRGSIPLDPRMKWLEVPNFKRRLSRFLYLAKIAVIAVKTNADLYHCHNPDTIPIVLILKLVGKKVIYDTHEDFSQRIMMRRWIPSPFRKILAGIITAGEKLVAKLSEAIIVTQDPLITKYGKKAVKIANPPIIKGPLIDEAKKYASQLTKDDSIRRLIYVGSISEGRGLFEMVHLVETLRKHLPVKLVLIGPASDNDIARAKKLPGWAYTEYLGPLPQYQAFGHMAISDVGLCIIHDVGDHKNTSPNKLFEYLTFGIPVVASNFRNWSDLFRDDPVGYFVNPMSSDEVLNVTLNLLKEPEEAKSFHKNGQYFLNQFNWHIEEKTLIKIYSNIHRQFSTEFSDNVG